MVFVSYTMYILNKEKIDMKLFKKLLIPLLLVFLSASIGVSQSTSDTVATYKATKQSSMTISGTSTVHDWEADVKEFNVELDISVNKDKAQTPEKGDYKAIRFEAPVKKIESGKGGMNKKIYNALKEDKHPEISFRMNEINNVSSSTEDTTFTLVLKGDITIAGKTRTITISDVEGQSLSDGSFKYKGEKSMKMTDFEVDPPSAMFGAIKAGDEITISFDLTMSPMNKETASK